MFIREKKFGMTGLWTEFHDVAFRIWYSDLPSDSPGLNFVKTWLEVNYVCWKSYFRVEFYVIRKKFDSDMVLHWVGYIINEDVKQDGAQHTALGYPTSNHTGWGKSRANADRLSAIW